MVKLIIFDLDGTLAESKQPLAGDMPALIARLLFATKVAVVSDDARNALICLHSSDPGGCFFLSCPNVGGESNIRSRCQPTLAPEAASACCIWMMS